MIDNLFYALRVVRKRGLGFFWTYFSESVWFDLRRGTSTYARVTKERQSIDSSAEEQDNGLLYVASFTSVTRKTVEKARKILGPDLADRAQFLDLGCGKGKALLVYAERFGAQAAHPAVGIEYDPGLAERARANATKCGFGEDRIKVVAASATVVREHILSETAIIYLYNSFQGETLRQVLEALKGVAHVLIYVDPAEREVLADYGYTIHAENTGKYNADTWLIATSGLDGNDG